MPARISSPGLRVAPQPERRVLLGEALDRGGDLLLLALDLRRHGEAHHGLGEAERGRLHGDLAIGEQVAGLDVLQLGNRAEVALAELLRRGRRLALELQQRAHPLLRVLAVVDERRLGRHLALQHAEEVDLPGERVGDRLEDERGGRRAFDVEGRTALRGRRDALDEQVEERVRAEVLRRDGAADGEDLAARHAELERRRDVVLVELLALEVALHQRLVDLHDLVEQLLAVLLRQLRSSSRGSRPGRTPSGPSGER